MVNQLLHTELGLWASAASLPSFGPSVGMLLLEIRNRAVEAVDQGIAQDMAIDHPSLRTDIQQWIDALDLVCGVAAVQQGQAINTLEEILRREGRVDAEDSDKTGNDKT